MRKNIEMELPDEQAGFRTGRGTADMLVIIQVLIEKIYGHRSSSPCYFH